MKPLDWFKIKEKTVELRILVKPNAKKSALIGLQENELHIALHAKPHKGEANKELINFLSLLLQVPKTKLTLSRGENSRHKLITTPLSSSIQKFIASTE